MTERAWRPYVELARLTSSRALGAFFLTVKRVAELRFLVEIPALYRWFNVEPASTPALWRLDP